MKSITPSARMSHWTETPARAETYRLPDPAQRRRAAEHALRAGGTDGFRAQLQSELDAALAMGADGMAVLRRPMNRRRLLRTSTALRERRMADALLAL